MTKPTIFLAFANDRDAYLPLINRERKNIYRALRRHDDEGLIKVEKEASSTLDDIFDIFQSYPDEVCIFHYGGHAGGEHLQLESDDASAQQAYAAGLAELLGQQQNLQLVFLNGCATQPQVELLLKHGVRSVIATSVSIKDQMATEFAEQFYNSLASHTPIQRAFQIAKAFITAKYRDTGNIQIYRAGFSLAPQSEEMPWGLYVHPDATDVLQWSLPKRVSNKQTIRNRFDYERRPDVNDILIDIICEDLAALNPDLDYELNKKDLDIPSIKREIVDSFPTPVGEHLRKLFTRSNDPEHPDDMELYSLARLEQLAVTHRTTMQFICYILLSQLWDEKHKNPELKVSEEYIVDFNSFFALGKTNYRSFDFVKLINTVTELFDDYKIPYFIDELKSLKIEANESESLYEAYTFMNSLYEHIVDENVAAEEYEDLCQEAEYHLALVLKRIAFLVKYKLVTIKNIETVKYRHQQARFRHHQITLNRALTVANIGVDEVGIEFTNFTDSKSVIFLKTKEDKVSEFLNLTPFIIDENALNNNYSSKLFLFAYQGETDYSYLFLNNLDDDPLVVDEENHLLIKEQFDRFRSDIFGLEYQPTPKTPKIGGSRFSRKR
ncbi:MAG: CHAT domain-containing protein [Lewinella sp.]|nr:CHAT domain-containing protein [Lewinella sp.]